MFGFSLSRTNATGPKPTKGNKLNLTIAKTDRLSSRLIGMQLTTGTLIGIALSALQMSAGFIIKGQSLIHGNFFLALMVAGIGIALAILVERLSIGGLSGIRVASTNIKEVNDAYYGMLLKEKRDPTDTEKTSYDKQHKALKTQRGWSVVFACIGMILSAGIGETFWETLFSGLGGMGVVLSIGCALVISLTFLHSELYKFLIRGVLKEIIDDQDLMKSAVAAEGQAMQVDLLVAAFDSVRDNESVRLPAQSKVERAVIRSLSGAADQFALQNNVTIYESPNLPAIGHGAQAQLPAPKNTSKYMQCRDELRRLLINTPTISAGVVATHFTISKSTAHVWLQKVKAGA